MLDWTLLSKNSRNVSDGMLQCHKVYMTYCCSYMFILYQKMSELKYLFRSFRIHGVDVSFGDDSGSEFSEYVCAKLPYLGTITKDCFLMVSFSNVNGKHIKHSFEHFRIMYPRGGTDFVMEGCATAMILTVVIYPVQLSSTISLYYRQLPFRYLVRSPIIFKYLSTQ